MKIKCLLLMLLAICISSNAKSQFYYSKINDAYEDAKKIKDATLLVVTEDDTASVLSLSIKNAIKEYWTFMEYSFISMAEMEKYKDMDGYYFLTIYGVYREGDKKKKVINYTYTIKAPNSAENSSASEATFCLPGCKSCNDNAIGVYDYSYLIPLIIRYWNNHFEYCYNSEGKTQSDFKTKYSPVNKGTLKTYYNNGLTRIPKMTLYYCNDNIKDTVQFKKDVAKLIDVDEKKIFSASSSKMKTIIEAKGENIGVIVNYDIYSVKEAELLFNYSITCTTTYGK